MTEPEGTKETLTVHVMMDGTTNTSKNPSLIENALRLSRNRNSYSEDGLNWIIYYPGPTGTINAISGEGPDSSEKRSDLLLQQFKSALEKASSLGAELKLNLNGYSRGCIVLYKFLHKASDMLKTDKKYLDLFDNLNLKIDCTLFDPVATPWDDQNNLTMENIDILTGKLKVKIIGCKKPEAVGHQYIFELETYIPTIIFYLAQTEIYLVEEPHSGMGKWATVDLFKGEFGKLTSEKGTQSKEPRENFLGCFFPSHTRGRGRKYMEYDIWSREATNIESSFLELCRLIAGLNLKNLIEKLNELKVEDGILTIEDFVTMHVNKYPQYLPDQESPRSVAVVHGLRPPLYNMPPIDITHDEEKQPSPME